MIRAEGLTKELGGRPVLDGLTMHVEHGKVVAVFGPNGVGKSTLLRCLVGITRLDRGQIWLDGRPAHPPPAEIKRRMGFLSHHSFLYDALSAEENLTFWARIYGVRDARRRVKDLLRRMGLWLFASDPVRTFSRGMVQRLAIARVLLPDPDILLLDEPFTGLDRAGAKLLTGILGGLKAEGRTLVMVSHRPDEVADVADRFLVLGGGRIRAEIGRPGPAGRPPGDPSRLVAEIERALDSILDLEPRR